ncbi:hypothetical protein D3C87_2113000 [compost metagenome]
MEKKLKIFESDKRTCQTFAEIVINKSIIQAKHRNITKQYKKDNHGKQHEIIGRVCPEI